MTEQTQTPTSEAVEYSEVFIGECFRDCGRPATKRIHKDWVACALHYHEWQVTEQINEAELATDLIKAWRSIAEFHGCVNLMIDLDRIAEDEGTRLNEANEDQAALEQIDRESEENIKVRTKMGEKRRELGEEKVKTEAASSESVDEQDNWPGTKEERAEYDARSELEAWEWVQSLLGPWTKASEPIGSPELTQVMEKTLAEVNATVERAREDWEKAKAQLEKETRDV